MLALIFSILLTLLSSNATLYEDGSYRVFGSDGCLPFSACQDDVVWTQTLQAWSDPNDYQEALYVHLPDSTCGMDYLPDTNTLKLILCEI